MVLSPLDRNILNNENKFHWDKFYNLGIIHRKPFNIKNKIQELGGKVNSWWYSENTQNAIKKFTYSNAFKDKKSLDRIENILKNNLNNYESNTN